MNPPEQFSLPPVHKLPALNLGLRPCAPSDWLDAPDAFGDDLMRTRQLAEKKHLIAEQKSKIYACLPDAQAAETEATAALTEHLHIYHQHSLPSQKTDSLLSVSARIPEDILIMLPTAKGSPNADWVLGAASLCFPSHWRLQDKMGKSIRAIHSPVPDFAEVLARPVIRFFTNMQIGRLSQRLNWSVQTEDKLHTPHHTPMKLTRRTANDWGNIIHIRIERQCFFKLPVTGAIIFSIRTSLAPLNKFQETPEFPYRVLQQTEKLSEAFYSYKNLSYAEEGLRIWIDKYMPQTT